MKSSPRNGSGSNGCEAWRGKALLHLEGDLGQTESAAFRKHLSACPACRSEIAIYEAIFRAIRELPEKVPASGFEAAVLRAILPQRVEDFWRDRAVLFARAYGTMVAVLFAAAMLVTLVVVGRIGASRALVEMLDTSIGAGDWLAERFVSLVVWGAKTAEVLYRTGQKLEPVFTSLGVAARAYQGEILGGMAILTLLALLGLGQIAPARLERRLHRGFLTV
jgi:anti-sigma factor RsiW